MTIESILQQKFKIKPRFVEKEDAVFILQLRMDQKLSRYISATVDDAKMQEEWIEKYKIREKLKQEFYFIFENENKDKFGVNRIYNIDTVSFEIGSWLFAQNSPEGVSILADLFTRDFAFQNIPSMEYCRFEVRKDNKSVVSYHKRFNPELIAEDSLSYYFKLSRDSYMKFRNMLISKYSQINIYDFLNKFKGQFIDEDSINLTIDDDFRKIESYDSLTGMAILVMIKDELGIDLTDEEYKSLHTVKAIYEYVISKK